MKSSSTRSVKQPSPLQTLIKPANSPPQKENKATIGSKYAHLLKARRENSSFHKNENISNTNPLILERASFIKKSNKNLMDSVNNMLFSKNGSVKANDAKMFEKYDFDDRDSEIKVISSKDFLNSGISKKDQKNGFLTPCPENIGYRSPPIINKTNPNLINSFHSGGKNSFSNKRNFSSKYIQKLQESNPIKKKISSPITYKTTDISNFSISNSAGNELHHSVNSIMNSDKEYTGEFQFLSNGVMYNYTCLNHQDKKSKYYTYEVVNILSETYHKSFCSKCSIQLIKGGVDCEEIVLEKAIEENSPETKVSKETQEEIPENLDNLSESEKQRKHNIDIFIEQLHNKYSLCAQTLNILENKKETTERMYANNIQELNSLFKEIQSIIDQQFAKCNKVLVDIQNQNKMSFDKNIENLNLIKSDFEFIQNDIDQYYIKIIRNIETGPFQNILKKYYEKIEEFNSYEYNLSNTFIPTKEILIKKENLQIDLKSVIQFKESQLQIFNSKVINLEDSYQNISINEEKSKLIDSMTDMPSHFNQHFESLKRLRTSGNKEDITKSDVYVSFDQNTSLEKIREGNETDEINTPNESEIIAENNIGKKFSEMLKKIDNAQSAKESDYQKLLQNKISDSRNEFNTSESSIMESEDRIFELDSRNDNENWEQKQTPDLGEKVILPEFMQSHFNDLSKTINNNNNNNNNVEKENTDEADLNKKYKFNCQKVLFN